MLNAQCSMLNAQRKYIALILRSAFRIPRSEFRVLHSAFRLRFSNNLIRNKKFQLHKPMHQTRLCILYSTLVIEFDLSQLNYGVDK